MRAQRLEENELSRSAHNLLRNKDFTHNPFNLKDLARFTSKSLIPKDRGRGVPPDSDDDHEKTTMKIGVLALQGDFDAHRRRLEELGADVVLVKKPEQLSEIDGLVIPGGESGTFLKLLGEDGFARLKDFVRAKPTFGTCAGCILLASEVENPKQAGLGALDITVRRNAYGRQIDSSIREGRFLGEPIEMVFIRAPKIERVGPGVEVIATEGTDPVIVRQGKALAATFHPELSDNRRVHRYFMDMVEKQPAFK
jgi:pyridoxal 5'-phosphate synthase pdxT subunit